ncbi:CLUMA_CG015249, isoform A [Clunio marinus]|uniref:CLUMA_CG015249, isoform A n=1 Tax=Clunio marinus TaxID=568069 RepID=A0A1J1IT45_9DIPT|nr:CLUMA_CG015249, isoform A [Clunio marinus]
MSLMKQSIEEKMSQSIFYNFNIMKRSVKTTCEFEEVLSPTMFIKSNTKAFIHVTHFLFNIIDQKEFKAKFLWPILDKKRENIYRTSSVEFVNRIIEKYNLRRDKITLAFVVHPTGKKFMSLILDLIILASNELMKRRNFSHEKSFDINKAIETVSEIKYNETELIAEIAKYIQETQENILAIQQFLEKIYPKEEFTTPFPELIASWNEHNIRLLYEIKKRNGEIKEIYKKAGDVHERATNLLTFKNNEIFSPKSEEIRDVVDFYENNILGALNESKTDQNLFQGELTYSWLIHHLNHVIDAILQFVTNYSPEDVEAVKEYSLAIEQFVFKLDKIKADHNKWQSKIKKTIPEIIQKLKILKDEEKKQEETSISLGELEECESDGLESEDLKLMLSPKYYFDVSEKCVRTGAAEKTRLALLNNSNDSEDGRNKENFNEKSKFYRSKRAPFTNQTSYMNQSQSTTTMGPPNSLRKRFDSMEILNRAKSVNKNNVSNLSSKYTGTIRKQISSTPRLSSTMFPGDSHFSEFNFSGISEVTYSPDDVVNGCEGRKQIIETEFEIERIIKDNILCFDAEVKDKDQSVSNIISLERAEKTMVLKSKITDEDNEIHQHEYEPTEEFQKTVENSSFPSLKHQTDEDLFNISDTILKTIEE